MQRTLPSLNDGNHRLLAVQGVGKNPRARATLTEEMASFDTCLGAKLLPAEHHLDRLPVAWGRLRQNQEALSVGHRVLEREGCIERKQRGGPPAHEVLARLDGNGLEALAALEEELSAVATPARPPAAVLGEANLCSRASKRLDVDLPSPPQAARCFTRALAPCFSIDISVTAM